MAQEGRRVWLQAWKNFINSFGLMKPRGSQIGQDHFGTKYFEIPAEPERGKRKARRWFETKIPDTFDQEMPAEWEAWLRGRRKDPPTAEEIDRNIAKMNMAKMKAKELEEKEHSKAAESPETRVATDEEKKKFPTYEEYEPMPGTPSHKSKR